METFLSMLSFFQLTMGLLGALSARSLSPARDADIPALEKRFGIQLLRLAEWAKKSLKG
jgi:hypothetical protein